MNDHPPSAGGEEPMLGLEPVAAATPYRVLARKYRPQRFEDLIGQEAMVRTLRNAFASGRIAHAFMLTGVRGVGKTTTARIIARALNYETKSGLKGPTVDMPEPGIHDAAIAESRHPDVIEMDAASRTGINDIREIIEGVRYAPVSARYKVYIIDEVHMLSKEAFNGLLKTLEEPPPHVKFIFATTEVRKIPVTVLSRCQRFDLRRVEVGELSRHLAKICGLESTQAEPEALAFIARAAEGSVRDALSVLDQAIAQGDGKVGTVQVRDMLGLADRGRTLDLLERILAGKPAEALTLFAEGTRAGADPLAVLQDLAGLVHQATKAKILEAPDETLPEAERARTADIAAKAGTAQLGRAWQLLLKGITEVQGAGNGLAAAEMVLIRLAHLADLPSPEELVRRLDSASASTPSSPRTADRIPDRPQASRASGAGPARTSAVAAEAIATAPMASAAPTMALATIEAVLAEAEKRREHKLAREIKDDMHVSRFERGRIEFEPGERASPDLAARLSRTLQEWTGERWMIMVVAGGPKPETLRTRMVAAEAALKAEVAKDPLIAAILDKFPGSKIADIKVPTAAPATGDDEPSDNE